MGVEEAIFDRMNKMDRMRGREDLREAGALCSALPKIRESRFQAKGRKIKNLKL